VPQLQSPGVNFNNDLFSENFHRREKVDAFSKFESLFSLSKRINFSTPAAKILKIIVYNIVTRMSRNGEVSNIGNHRTASLNPGSSIKCGKGLVNYLVLN